MLIAVVLAATACSGGSGRAERRRAGTSRGATAATTTGATTATPGGSPATVDTSQASGVYGDLSHWMCHPALADADNRCLDDLDVTFVESDGRTRVVHHTPAEHPAVDCFYVYPTISGDPSANSDLEPAEGEEVQVLKNQAARLGQVCEVWAPVYRQLTLTTLLGRAGAGDQAGALARAYSDVRDAWKTYLAQSEPGRGVVLIGHSQGSALLTRLVREEIDGDEALRSRMVSALLLGWPVVVPEGADVGGDFQHVPLCRAVDQTGCVVSYSTFRSTSPPPPDSRFARPRGQSGTAACVNPAAPAGGRASLQGIFRSTESPWAPGAAGRPAVTTPYYSLPGLLEGECVQRGGFSYLELTVHGDPSDPRRDDIGGDMSPDWGMHLVDVDVAMGDLVDMVTAQAAAYAKR